MASKKKKKNVVKKIVDPRAKTVTEKAFTILQDFKNEVSKEITENKAILEKKKEKNSQEKESNRKKHLELKKKEDELNKGILEIKHSLKTIRKDKRLTDDLAELDRKLALLYTKTQDLEEKTKVLHAEQIALKLAQEKLNLDRKNYKKEVEDRMLATPLRVQAVDMSQVKSK